jgi:hypothetical protein
LKKNKKNWNFFRHALSKSLEPITDDDRSLGVRI